MSFLYDIIDEKPRLLCRYETYCYKSSNSMVYILPPGHSNITSIFTDNGSM